MSARAQAHISIDQPKGWTWPWVPAAVLAVSIATIGTIEAFRLIGDLESMQADVHRMSERLGVLDSVNQKLGKLDTLSAELSSMRGELNLTLTQLRRANGLLAAANGQLVTADGQLDVANGSMKSLIATTRGMNDQLRSVAAMSADIHEVAHKIDDSFLFRGVK